MTRTGSGAASSAPIPTAAFTPARPAAPGRWSRALMVSALTLGLTIALVGSKEVWSRFTELDPIWIGTSMALSLVEVVLAALRWSFLSSRAGVGMRVTSAMHEYGMSTLLNQVLPSGVAGDLVRVHRHATSAAGPGRAARCVEAALHDRLSGQLALGLVALATVPVVLLPRSGLARWFVTPGLLGLAGVLAWLGLNAASQRSERVANLRCVLRRSLREWFGWRSLSVHLALSVALVCALVLHYYTAARAAGIAIHDARALATIPWILLAASLPSFLGGWGVREGAAASLFYSVQAGASIGVAVSIAFGVLSLVGSAASALLLALATGWTSRSRPHTV